MIKFSNSWTRSALTPEQEMQILKNLQACRPPQPPQPPEVMCVDVTEADLQRKMQEFSRPPWAICGPPSPSPTPGMAWRIFYRRAQVFAFLEGM